MALAYYLESFQAVAQETEVEPSTLSELRQC